MPTKMYLFWNACIALLAKKHKEDIAKNAAIILSCYELYIDRLDIST